MHVINTYPKYRFGNVEYSTRINVSNANRTHSTQKITYYPPMSEVQ